MRRTVCLPGRTLSNSLSSALHAQSYCGWSFCRSFGSTTMRGSATALVRLSEIAGRDSDYLAAQAASALFRCDAGGRTLGGLTLDRAALAALHPALLRYVVRLAMEQVRGTAEGIGYEMTRSRLPRCHKRLQT